MKVLLVIILLPLFCLGQTKKDIYDMPIPKNLEKAFEILDATLSDKEIAIIRETKEDSISFHPEFKDGTDFFHAWKIYDGSRLTKYFNKKGLYESFPIYETILISYHHYLNKEDLNLKNTISKFQKQKEEDLKVYKLKLEKDSINGVYIPIDLNDSFKTLDKILSDTDKQSIKNAKDKNEVLSMTHHSLGMWLRNNWGLWGGSRLQKYFLDKNIKHPDNMSSLILEYYYDWLNSRNEDWQKWEQK